jgi:hypothetical protein
VRSFVITRLVLVLRARSSRGRRADESVVLSRRIAARLTDLASTRVGPSLRGIRRIRRPRMQSVDDSAVRRAWLAIATCEADRFDFRNRCPRTASWLPPDENRWTANGELAVGEGCSSPTALASSAAVVRANPERVAWLGVGACGVLGDVPEHALRPDVGCGDFLLRRDSLGRPTGGIAGPRLLPR